MKKVDTSYLMPEAAKNAAPVDSAAQQFSEPRELTREMLRDYLSTKKEPK